MSRRLRSSMRITSAPKSARILVAVAPTPIQQKSVTRIPARGPERGRGRREGSVGTSVIGANSIEVVDARGVVVEDLAHRRLVEVGEHRPDVVVGTLGD